MKKWSLGNGTILTANLRKSAFNWPGKRRQVVTPDIVIDTETLRGGNRFSNCWSSKGLCSKIAEG